ncbi:hypothetical protein EYC84_002241 [Monilinia fructicola]|uniref:Uncharacterized protein n=1 Tax=Monilinia fructicola TaxID=38448 RepID=A0A5M9JML1_MONFR|nr:hypothetical protein EYC84_002241 [Monilinia fructicola]
MTRQVPEDPPESQNRTANHPPAPPPSPTGSANQQEDSLYDLQSQASATNKHAFKDKLDDFQWKSKHLDHIITANSEFSSFREFELFLHLYKKQYNHMDDEEHFVLVGQISSLQKRMTNPISKLAFAEAHQSIWTGGQYLSLEHFASQNENGEVIRNMINDCVLVMSKLLEEAMEDGTSAQTTQDNKNNWKEMEIERIKALVIRHGTHDQRKKLSNAVRDDDMTSDSEHTPPHCPDPPVYQHVYNTATANTASDLQRPWNHDECVGYLARRVANFMTSSDPESFVFSLPSATRLEHMTADERAEFVRQHLIEQDAKYDSGLNGTRMNRRERVVKHASHNQGSDLLYAALANAREDRYRNAQIYGYDKNPDRSNRLSWSTLADDGKSDTSFGDGPDFGWLPNRSREWSSPQKATKHVSFDPSTKGASAVHEQNGDDTPTDTADFADSESEWTSTDGSASARNDLGREHLSPFHRDTDLSQGLRAMGGQDASWKDSVARAMEVWASDPESGNEDALAESAPASSVVEQDHHMGGRGAGLPLEGRGVESSAPLPKDGVCERDEWRLDQ